jgi:hypothetical protein
MSALSQKLVMGVNNFPKVRNFWKVCGLVEVAVE